MTKLSLSEFVEQYSRRRRERLGAEHLIQQLYDLLNIKIWFFHYRFSEDMLEIFVSDEDPDTITEIHFSGRTETNDEREESIKALNNYFNKVEGVKISPPSLYVGITKIYASEEDCKSEWKIENLLGRGIQGISYATCCEVECDSSFTHVMKIEDTSTEAYRSDFIREAELSKLFGFNGIGPVVISIYIGKYVGIIIMERLTITLRELEPYIIDVDMISALRIVNIIKGKFLTVISKLHKLGYVHRDIHGGNIMLKIDMKDLTDNLLKGKYELKLIDFGMTKEDTVTPITHDEENFDIWWYQRIKKKIRKHSS
jgi:serine/threonine protein kinase